MRASIIIGPSKTGTSAVAAGFTSLQRNAALPPGVVYPIDDLWPFGPQEAHIVKHHELKGIDHEGSVGQTAVNPTKVRHALHCVAELGRSFGSSGHAVFVWEILMRRIVLDKTSIVAFDAVLREYFDEVGYVLTIRRQDEAVRSAVHQAIRHDERLSKATTTNLDVRGLPQWLLLQLDYWAAYERFAAADLSAALTLVPFVENDIGSSRHLLRMTAALGIGIVDVTVTDLDQHRIHPSLSKRDLNRIARTRDLQERFAKGSVIERALDRAWQKDRTLSTRRAMRLDEHGRRRSYERWRATSEEAAGILAYYRDSNEKLFALHPEVDFLN